MYCPDSVSQRAVARISRSDLSSVFVGVSCREPDLGENGESGIIGEVGDGEGGGAAKR